MSLVEETLQKQFGEIIVKEAKGEPKKAVFDKALILKVLAFLSPSLLLVLWEIFSRLGVVDIRLFSSPIMIFKTMVPMLYSGELLYHTFISAQRIVLGFLAGAVPGVILGLSMGLFAPIRASLMPMVSATFPIPKLAIMPLILIVFGLGEASKIFTIAIGVFYLVLINTMAGVLNIDDIYLDVAKNFGASPFQFYTTVAFPGALPMIFAGFKLGMGTALLLIVAAELSAAKAGVGWLVWRAYDMFDIEKMFVALITLAFLGYIFSYLLEIAEKVVIPWKNDRR
ncbi:MAG TPA: ABC transporter permease [Thermoanaerobacterales bacterium]|uniref:ABC transporter permease n=1 Tax=Tepidanaerobacter sp. GT38 TaxID=2722793 RepID=UPI00184B3133|nr:ABC transporter permease [Tepidanaerobacter sp. GT38]MCG1011222.1 ABC transporter permease [Tepidanaerobacter sp. GT38]HHY42327.1 ABC transporter permease [Thermoanaerobacterales bacterium]